MEANVRWLYAFWRASRVLNDPAGRAIAKLDEWALTKLGAHARDMDGKAWFHYLRGAMAVLGIEPSLEAYQDGHFMLREKGFTRRQVMWSPNTGTFSVGIHWPEMTRYGFAIFMNSGEVSVRLKTADRDLVKELLILVHAVLDEEWKKRVKEAMGVNEDA